MYEVAEVLEVITKQMVRCDPMAETSMLEETYLLITRIRDALGSKLCELERMTIPAAKCRLERESICCWWLSRTFVRIKRRSST